MPPILGFALQMMGRALQFRPGGPWGAATVPAPSATGLETDMFRIATFLSAAVLLTLTSPAAHAQDETGAILVNAPLFKTKTSSKGSVKFTPFKSGKEPFVVTVRLYDGNTGDPILDEDGLTPWAEDVTFTSLDASPSNPAAGDLREPTKIVGRTDLVIGATKALPLDLVQRRPLFTTQVTTTKKGATAATFEESPRRPLGVDGATRGQALDPDAISTHALAVLDDAAAGRVLTSDADGNATWQELPAGPGVTGSVGRLAVFDSSASITDSIVSQSAGGVTVDGDLVADNTQFGTLSTFGDIVSGDDLIATNGLSTGGPATIGGNLTANGNMLATGNLVTSGNIQSGGALSAVGVSSGSILRAGSPSAIASAGDVVADDDLIADDDLQVGDAASIGGNLSVAGATSLTSVGVSTLSATGTVQTGSPSVSFAAGDIASTSDVMADEDVIANTGVVRTGTPSSTFTDGDVVATNDLVADVDVIATGGVIRTGSPSTQTLSSGDIAATDDLIADDDLFVGDDILAGGLISVGGTFVDNLTSSQSELQFRSNGDQVFIRDFNLADSGLVDETLWFDGPAGLGGDLEMRLSSAGSLSIDGNYTSGGADLAEWFPTRVDGLEPGTLVALDPSAPEHVLRAELGRFEVLLGVVPTAPGILMGGGDVMGPQPELLRASFVAAEEGDVDLARELRAAWRVSVDSHDGRVAVALQGRVPVKLDLSGGVVQPGDRIGLGATPGRGARYTGYGPVLGLAMEAYTGGDAPIVVFLDRDLSPDASSAPLVSASEIAARLPVDASSATLFAGRGSFPAGRTQVWVDDARLSSDSLPVVTFYGNPGSAFWVSQRVDGSFLLELAEPSAGPVPFGYTATR